MYLHFERKRLELLFGCGQVILSPSMFHFTTCSLRMFCEVEGVLQTHSEKFIQWPALQLTLTVEYVRTGEISDFWCVQEQAYFSELCYDQTSGHTNNQWVPNERFRHNLSIETLQFPVLQIGCLLQPVKVGHFSKNQKSAENSQILSALKS